jgi:hypothetical protein
MSTMGRSSSSSSSLSSLRSAMPSVEPKEKALCRELFIALPPPPPAPLCEARELERGSPSLCELRPLPWWVPGTEAESGSRSGEGGGSGGGGRA